MVDENRVKEGSVEYVSDVFGKMRTNPWMISTVVLSVLVVALVAFGVFGGSVGGGVSAQTASDNLVNFVKSQGQGSVSLVSSEKEGSLYKVTLSLQGQNVPVYVTNDGKYATANLIPLDATDVKETPAPSAEIPKSAKPSVELYVMSFCPFGVKAETNIMPLVELFKEVIDFKVRFIANVGGNTVDSIKSLHGPVEAKEDLRQLIIMRDYPAKFYSYLKEFNSKCYPLGVGDASKIDACWKAVAANLSIDVKAIETKAYGAEGIALMKADELLTTQLDISGSPTLTINSVKSEAIYSGTEATQTAICSAFNTVPSQCNTKVSAPAGSNSPPAGSC